MELRDYQNECILKIIKGFKKNPAQLITQPTGSGKTVIFVNLIKQVLELKPSLKVMVLVNKVVLVEQTVRQLQSFIDSEKIGVTCGTLN